MEKDIVLLNGHNKRTTNVLCCMIPPFQIHLADISQ
jgi:hypothetical protein